MDNRLPRKLRLVTGIVLFLYVVSHLGNLALGLHSIELMDELRPLLLRPWHNVVGTVALYGSMAVHALLGLHALYLRRTLRMTAFDGAQLLIGLVLPPLMVLHVLGTRTVFMQTGFESTYAWMMLVFWKWQPVEGLRQVLVVVLAWAHGCMGLYLWMRLQRWWPRVAGFAYPLAFAVPVLALLGFVEAGKEALALAADDGWMAAATAGSEALEDTVIARIYRIQALFVQGWLALLVLVLAARALRLRRAPGVSVVQIRHVDGPTIRVPAGLSLLEASRHADLPHASLCGGRGRCGTCRVHVLEGSGCLHAPSRLERETLTRLGADAEVRLACQAVPLDSPLTVRRLVPAGEPEALGAAAAVDGRRAVVVAGIELRAAPGDADAAGVLFALERLGAHAARALEGAGGRVIRSDPRAVRVVFGDEGASRDDARAALEAVREALAGLEALDAERTALGVHGGAAHGVLHAGEALVVEADGRPQAVGAALDELDAACAACAADPGSVTFTAAFATLAEIEAAPDDEAPAREAPALLAPVGAMRGGP